MAVKKKIEPVAIEQQKFKGSQLLKMTKYKSFVARLVIKPDELYSFEQADKLIFDFMKKKG